jgi:hypothetical protein
MLGLPCILNYMNNNQHDALFIFSVLTYHASTVDCQRVWLTSQAR